MNADCHSLPKISVIIPTHNRSILVKRAILSVLNQTEQDFEIIVVDDYSNDDTTEVLKGIKDERLKIIRHQENKGGSATRNTGINLARGKYYAFLDDDDEWLSTKLAKQMSVFDKGDEKLGVVTCSRAKFKDGKKFFEYRPGDRGDVYNYLVNTWGSFGTSTAIIKREFLNQSGYFDEALPSHQELDLFIRLARVCRFDFVDEILVNNHIYEQRIGGNVSNGIKGKEIVLNKIADDMEKLSLSRHLVELGRYYCYVGDLVSGRKGFIKSIKINPLAWQPYVHLISTIFGKDVYFRILLLRNDSCKELFGKA